MVKHVSSYCNTIPHKFSQLFTTFCFPTIINSFNRNPSTSIYCESTLHKTNLYWHRSMKFYELHSFSLIVGRKQPGFTPPNTHTSRLRMCPRSLLGRRYPILEKRPKPKAKNTYMFWSTRRFGHRPKTTTTASVCCMVHPSRKYVRTSLH